ncbi:DNA-3-methyladenine glycosylase [Stenotrophomonas oahuensis]|uniref:Putative 3-methyladenine DNA glycosylase n=1 Tax=Stenotrophomonas oahuensis TaxID=3003271 RepID=A0ABY9YMB5_9GAMM|nr:DNA-3-methyladenine glycosylase [Stenotrophomonas sp. A5586]WNH52024.1 DNA-3-methyladenine glycosylase [Stenotrophomonas sp. A5586]
MTDIALAPAWIPADWSVLPRRFYARHPTEVAPELLNKLLVRDDGRAARIVEVEAYAGGEDPAAHSYRGKTARNATMFGEAGHLYVYFTYGMHWGSNAVCGPVGEGMGVLLRAAEPVSALDLMRASRPAARRDRDLASGPGKLSQAFGITRALDGADLVRADSGVAIVSDGVTPPDSPWVGPRIGISKAVEIPWRWCVPDHPHVSVRPRRSPP